MKKLLCLAFFGLLAQVALGQMIEINSPTSSNLNCILTVSPPSGPGDLTVYIFGDNGLGYVSKDKCASWQQLNIDPIKKRAIHLAVRVTDKLMLLSGGKYNDLFKISTDGGATFTDFALSNKKPIYSMSQYALEPIGSDFPYYPPAVIFSHKEAYGTLWYDEWNTSDPAPLCFITNSVAYNQVSDGFVLRFVCERVGGNGPFCFYFVQTIINKQDRGGFESPMIYDSISSIDAYKDAVLLSLKSRKGSAYYGALKNGDVYESFANKDEQIFSSFRLLPELGEDMAIKSSLITRAKSICWHVGYNRTKTSSFIVFDGKILQRMSDIALSAIADCSYNNKDAVIIIGSKGKIFSNRIDLATSITDAAAFVNLNEFSVYPNPVYDNVIITSEGNDYVSLLNILGSTVKQIHLTPGNNNVSLTNLISGVYFLKNEKKVLKLIKQ